MVEENPVLAPEILIGCGFAETVVPPFEHRTAQTHQRGPHTIIVSSLRLPPNPKKLPGWLVEQLL